MFCGSWISVSPGPNPDTTRVSLRATSLGGAAGLAAAAGAAVVGAAVAAPAGAVVGLAAAAAVVGAAVAAPAGAVVGAAAGACVDWAGADGLHAASTSMAAAPTLRSSRGVNIGPAIVGYVLRTWCA